MLHIHVHRHIQGLVDLLGFRDICSVMRGKGPGGARKQKKKQNKNNNKIKLEREETEETGERERSGTGHASILRRLPTICPPRYIFYIVRITDENIHTHTAYSRRTQQYFTQQIDLPHSCSCNI